MAYATDEDIRAEWDRLVRTIHGNASQPASAGNVCLDLCQAYACLGLSETRVVDPILAAWLDDPDRDRRYEALFLIAEHRIIWALPALRDLAARLEQSDAPTADAEREAVLAVIDLLLPVRRAA